MPMAEQIFQNKALFKTINNFAAKTQNTQVHACRRVTNKDPSSLSISAAP